MDVHISFLTSCIISEQKADGENAGLEERWDLDLDLDLLPDLLLEIEADEEAETAAGETKRPGLGLEAPGVFSTSERALLLESDMTNGKRRLPNR